MRMCAYVGPAPVPLEDYVEQSYRQAVTGISVSPEGLRSHFSHLVLRDELFNSIGPALAFGKSVFVYGPPANRQTAMATAIGQFITAPGPRAPARGDQRRGAPPAHFGLALRVRGKLLPGAIPH